MSFQSFEQLGNQLIYLAPDDERSARHKAAAKSVADLALAAEHPERGFGAWQDAVMTCHRELTEPIGPKPSPGATTAFRALQDVRMYGTRAIGGGALGDGEQYRAPLKAALTFLEVAVQAAIADQG